MPAGAGCSHGQPAPRARSIGGHPVGRDDATECYTTAAELLENLARSHPALASVLSVGRDVGNSDLPWSILPTRNLAPTTERNCVERESGQAGVAGREAPDRHLAVAGQRRGGPVHGAGRASLADRGHGTHPHRHPDRRLHVRRDRRRRLRSPGPHPRRASTSTSRRSSTAARWGSSPRWSWMRPRPGRSSPRASIPRAAIAPSAAACTRSTSAPRPTTTTSHADNEILVIIQTEHIDAVEIADEIYSVPGLDAVFVGPNDLAYSMRRPTDRPEQGGLRSDP